MKLDEFNRENHYSELHAQYLKLKQQNAEYIEALREAAKELHMRIVCEAGRMTTNPQQVLDHLNADPLLNRLKELLK